MNKSTCGGVETPSLTFPYMKTIVFLAFIFFVTCLQDENDKKIESILPYRGKVQDTFSGYNSIEGLLVAFFKELSTEEKNIEKFVINDEEYLKVYLPNEDMDTILRGSTPETMLSIWKLSKEKNINSIKNNFEEKGAVFLSYELENVEKKEVNEIYYIRKIYLKKGNSIIPVSFIHSILKHNGKYKILGIREFD